MRTNSTRRSLTISGRLRTFKFTAVRRRRAAILRVLGETAPALEFDLAAPDSALGATLNVAWEPPAITGAAGQPDCAAAGAPNQPEGAVEGALDNAVGRTGNAFDAVGEATACASDAGEGTDGSLTVVGD